MALQIRRGNSTEMTASVTPLDGEPIWNADTGKLYIGNGSLTANLLTAVNDAPTLSEVVGVNPVNNQQDDVLFYNASSGDYENEQITFQKLSDLNYTTPSNGDVISYDDSIQQFVIRSPLASQGSFATLSDTNFTVLQDEQVAVYDSTTQRWLNINFDTKNLSDVQDTTFQDNQLLVYNTGNSRFQPVDKNALLSLSDLSNVASTAPSNGQALTWNATSTRWEPSTLSNATLAGLTDVNAIGVQNDQILVYNSINSQWEAENKVNISSLGAISDVSSSSPNDGDVLAWSAFANEWGPATTYGTTVIGLNALTDVTVTTPSAGETLVYDSLTGNFENQAIPGGSVSGLSDTSISSLANNQILVYNSSTSQWENQNQANTGTSLQGRATVSVTEYSVGAGSSVDTSFNTAKTYALLEVTATINCWITFYTDSTSRYNDSTRTSGTDPAGGSGVIAEVFTTGVAGQTETVIMTPSVFGFNMDSTPSNTCYMKIENQHTSAQNITVSLKYLQLES